jgi:hypothetical protein
MRIATEISTRVLRKATDDSRPVSEILLGGKATGVELRCELLEEAVALPGFFLLFTTDDTPFEEVLGIHLYDAALRHLDSAQLGGPYTTGAFSSLQLLPPDRLSFRFIGDTAWTVQVLPRPALRSLFRREPIGVWRGLRLKRHFIVEGSPKPEFVKP